MGFQIEKSLIKGWRDLIGKSLLYGFNKPYLGFAEGKLYIRNFPISDGKRRNDVPIGMIKRRAKVVNCITQNYSSPIYDGFISFCEGGTLSCLCICFENIGERSLFLEQHVQLVDVFRGTLNLEIGAIFHGNKTPNGYSRAETSGLLPIMRTRFSTH